MTHDLRISSEGEGVGCLEGGVYAVSYHLFKQMIVTSHISISSYQPCGGPIIMALFRATSFVVGKRHLFFTQLALQSHHNLLLAYMAYIMILLIINVVLKKSEVILTKA